MSSNTKTTNSYFSYASPILIVLSVCYIALIFLFVHQKKVLSDRAYDLERELQKAKKEVHTVEIEKVVYKVPEKVEGKSTVYRMDKETILIVIDERSFKAQVKK